MFGLKTTICALRSSAVNLHLLALLMAEVSARPPSGGDDGDGFSSSEKQAREWRGDVEILDKMNVASASEEGRRLVSLQFPVYLSDLATRAYGDGLTSLGADSDGKFFLTRVLLQLTLGYAFTLHP